tara:strand:- start:182 stop:550 length:369 start_codon:yes stop_codon:yes gene_type:complete
MSKLLCNAIELLSPNSCLSGGLTYESVVWKENATNIPTKEQVESKIEELRLLIPMKKLRHERNIKLLETDKYSISDWPHASEEVKQAWITYRQELRDLPSNSTPQLDENGNLTNVTWPTPPS